VSHTSDASNDDARLPGFPYERTQAIGYASLPLNGDAVVTRASPASSATKSLLVAGELADFAPVGQSFCQGRQLCVKNAVSLGWIVTT
jgi:hypothetical protein